jgi:hypothetical protein
MELKNTKSYHTLFSGGCLTSVDTGDSGKIDLAMRKRMRTIPALSLMGTAIGNQMVEGKLKLGHAVPICAETLATLPAPVAKQFPDNAAMSMYSYVGHEFLTRKDDIKDERAEGEAPQQMIANFEVLAAGTPFYLRADLHDTNTVEDACFARALNLWRQRPFISGMSAKGYGRVKIMFATLDDSAYAAYLTEKRDEVVGVIDEIEAIL